MFNLLYSRGRKYRGPRSQDVAASALPAEWKLVSLPHSSITPFAANPHSSSKTLMLPFLVVQACHSVQSSLHSGINRHLKRVSKNHWAVGRARRCRYQWCSQLHSLEASALSLFTVNTLPFFCCHLNLCYAGNTGTRATEDKAWRAVSLRETLSFQLSENEFDLFGGSRVSVHILLFKFHCPSNSFQPPRHHRHHRLHHHQHQRHFHQCLHHHFSLHYNHCHCSDQNSAYMPNINTTHLSLPSIQEKQRSHCILAAGDTGKLQNVKRTPQGNKNQRSKDANPGSLSPKFYICALMCAFTKQFQQK